MPAGRAARRLPRLTNDAICKWRDAVRLGTSEAARPPGAANGPLSASRHVRPTLTSHDGCSASLAAIEACDLSAANEED